MVLNLISLSNLNTAIIYASYIVLLRFIFNLLNFFYKLFLRKRVNIYKKYGKGSWALVTGGSDGIGAGICEELAKMGFNILIAARTKSKIEDFNKYLKTKFNVETDLIAVDFSTLDQTYECYKSHFEHHFATKDIRILVNNVGALKRSLIRDLSLEEAQRMIYMNCFPQLYLTKLFLSYRSENCGIIDLSSSSSLNPMNYYNIYGPTKLFNYYQTLGVALEEKKIDFLSVRPFTVQSPLSGNLKPDGWLVISARECAKGIFDSFGHDLETCGSWRHNIIRNILGCFPESVQNYIARRKIEKLRGTELKGNNS